MTKSDVTTAEEWFTGEDTAIVFKIKNASTVAPQDITGWAIEWKLASVLAGEPILSIAATITDAPNGVCQVTVDSAATIDLEPGTYFYDLRRVDPGSFALLAYGTVELLDPYVDEDPWKVLQVPVYGQAVYGNSVYGDTPGGPITEWAILVDVVYSPVLAASVHHSTRATADAYHASDLQVTAHHSDKIPVRVDS